MVTIAVLASLMIILADSLKDITVYKFGDVVGSMLGYVITLCVLAFLFVVFAIVGVKLSFREDIRLDKK